MRASDVIEMYVDDTVRLLPKRMREDVAAELRALLNEELAGRAGESGRPADEALALSLVQGYGRPNEVAARYQPAWTIIDPADSQSFVRAAWIGAGSLIVLSVLSKLQSPAPGAANNFVTIGTLAWIGFLVVAFGTKSWMRHRWPAKAIWQPRDRDQANRIGAAIVIPVATLVLVLYGAPAWVLDHISGGRINTSWATYTPSFRQFGLPLCLGLMAGLLALLAFAAIQGRWTRLMRRIGIGLNLALALVVLAIAVQGNIFQSTAVDQIARSILALVAVIYVPGVGAQIYNEIGRVSRPAAANGA
jgi:hypothetical protein